MNVTQECLLSLLRDNGCEEDYIDVHTIGSVTYYFGSTTLKFMNGCVPLPIVQKYMALFELSHLLSQLQVADCLCDW